MPLLSGSCDGMLQNIMSPEYEKQLRDKYPNLFRKVRRVGRGPAPIETRGIECEDGWYDILDSLFDHLMRPLDWVKASSSNVADPDKVRAAPEREFKRLPALIQVKEKLGRLRIYIHGGNRRVGELVAFAEQHSGKVCEICGRTGIFRNDGWLRVRCDECEIASQDKQSF